MPGAATGPNVGTVSRRRGQNVASIPIRTVPGVWWSVACRNPASGALEIAHMSDVELNQQAPLSLLSRICHVAREDARSAAKSCSEAIAELQDLARDHTDDAVLRINLARPANDAFVHADVDDALAEIFAIVGDTDAALDRVVSVPSPASPSTVALEPVWGPHRSNPRFRRIVERNGGA